MEIREQKTDKGWLILNSTKYLLCLCYKVDRHFWGSQGRSLNKMQVRIPTVTNNPKYYHFTSTEITKGWKHSDWNYDNFLPSKFSSKVQEWLLKIIVALSWNLIVLQVLLPVKGNLLCLHLPVLYIHFVSAKNNRNVFADPEE